MSDKVSRQLWNGELSGKVVLVTGGTSGIGRETAIAFGRAGAKVIIAGRREAEGQDAVESVRATGVEALFVRCDVGDEADVQRVVQRAVDAFGRLDVAFNNAGYEGTPAAIADTSEAQWDLVTRVNLKGVFLCLKHEIRQMLAQGGGTIVNMSSVGGFIGKPGSAPYVASKHGVLGLTKTAALETASRGIRVNAICPAVIDGPMPQRIFADPAMMKQMIALHPMGRIGQPIEVANAVLWLSCNLSSFMTGQSITLDGGMLAGPNLLG